MTRSGEPIMLTNGYTRNSFPSGGDVSPHEESVYHLH